MAEKHTVREASICCSRSRE